MVTRIMVTGVRAVGKSTLVSHTSVPSGLTVYNYGHEMEKLGKINKILKDKTELEELNLPKRKKLQRLVAEEIDADHTPFPILVDGHLIVDSPSGFVPGLPMECIRKLKFTGIILLHTKPPEIIERRKVLAKKYNMIPQWDSEDRIEFHHRILRQACVNYMIQSDAHFEEIENVQGKLDSTVKRFLEVLEQMKNGF